MSCRFSACRIVRPRGQILLQDTHFPRVSLCMTWCTYLTRSRPMATAPASSLVFQIPLSQSLLAEFFCGASTLEASTAKMWLRFTLASKLFVDHSWRRVCRLR